MKDYFSMQYSSIFSEEKMKSLKDVKHFLKPISFINKKEVEDYCYLFKLPKGQKISFGLHGGEFLKNLDDELFKPLDKKYNIQDKLFSYYKNMVFHGVLSNEELYIFFIIYTDNEFCPGLYETSNLVSVLGFNFVNVINTKVKTEDDLIEGCVLTQRRGVDFSKKVFMLT